MKKLLLSLMVIGLLTACTGNGSGNESETIKVYTRDGASGTREAFESIIKLEALTDESAETSGNGDMAKQVGANKDAIGYVSLTTDFEANNLKALKYEGVEASIDTVNKAEYKLARPFSFVTRASKDFDSDEKEELVKAILDFLENSKEGREVVLSAGGIVDVDAGTPWDELKKNHPIVEQDNSNITIKTGGSTSVEKTLNEAISMFIPMAGNFKFEPNHTGSGDGFKRTLGSEKDGANTIDIGFASREFKDDEDVSTALLSGVYSKDAVVVVVNKDNDLLEDLNANQLVDIFSGKVTKWSEIK